MIINDLYNNKKQGVAEAGFPGAPDVEMPPMKPSGDPQRDKLKLEYMDIHREIKSLVDLQYRGTSEEKIQAKARIKQLNDRADEIKAILEPRQPPNEWQKKTYGYDDNWNRVGKGVAEGGIATVGWPDEGNHTGNNPPVSIGGTVSARPVVKQGSLVKASGLNGVHRVVDIRGDQAKIVQEIPNTGQSNYVPMSDLRVWTNKPIREQGVAEGMKAQELAMYCEKLVAEKGWDRAYKHALMMANVGRDPAWNGVLKYLDAMKQGMAEGKRPDTYHIVNKNGKPASLASYADKESAVKDRDAKHQGAEVRQLGPRGKVKGVSEAHDAAAKEIHGNLFHDSIPPGAEKHHVSAVLKAHGLKDTDAKDVINRVRKMGYAGPRLDKSDGSITENDSDVPVHRIGLTVIDPQHPMVSKRREEYQKTVRVPGHDREQAITAAINHLRRRGYKVLDHHYIGLLEASLGDYRKKAAVSKATSQMDRFFGRDDPAKVAQADQTIAKRERGLARADARVKPYTPPAHDAEKRQRELTAKYPNIDELVAQAEKNRDPYYDRAEGNAYYAGREAEQNYQKLKQIQRVIQGLNESLQTVKEFNPFSKKKATEPVTDTTPDPQANSGGVKFDLMGRPYKPAPVVAEPEPVAKPVGTAMPINPYQIPISNTNPTPAKPAVAPNTAMTTITPPKFNTVAPYTAPADDSELQTIPAPAQLTGPAPVKQLGTNYRDDVIDVDAKVKTQPEKQMALPAPVAKPDYSKGFSGYSNATMTPTASLPPSTKSMMPTNMMPNTAKAPSKPAVSTTAAKNDIIQALKQLGYKTKEAKAAIKGLPPNISISDAIRQVLRGKPTTTESLTWSASFDPGRSLYRRMKKES